MLPRQRVLSLITLCMLTILNFVNLLVTMIVQPSSSSMLQTVKESNVRQQLAYYTSQTRANTNLNLSAELCAQPAVWLINMPQ